MRFLTVTSCVLVAVSTLPGCAIQQREAEDASHVNIFAQYAADTRDEYHYAFRKTIPGQDVETHVLRVVSGRWLTENEVEEPEWWHWVRIVVPDSVRSTTALLYIGGGNRDADEPSGPPSQLVRLARATGSIAVHVHNVPNQPVDYLNDERPGLVEDEMIAHAWRHYLRMGAPEDSVAWLPRLPMTRAAIRAMDAAATYARDSLDLALEDFVVAGASKRGWTAWTTAIADERVVGVVPIVIDLLNITPSFEHHWRAYGRWAPAIGPYAEAGIMEWLGSRELERLFGYTDPHAYAERLTLPKLLINASGDQFFLPDSWQFYWDDLRGEKHLRYVPNTGHSLEDSDASETLVAFFHHLVQNEPRPEYAWSIEDRRMVIDTDPADPPRAVRLWSTPPRPQRDFRIGEAGEIWSSREIPLSADGDYRLELETPSTGWRGYFAELEYPGLDAFPLKFTTGVVILPDSLPHPPFQPEEPKGTQPAEEGRPARTGG